MPFVPRWRRQSAWEPIPLNQRPANPTSTSCYKDEHHEMYHTIFPFRSCSSSCRSSVFLTVWEPGTWSPFQYLNAFITPSHESSWGLSNNYGGSQPTFCWWKLLPQVQSHSRQRYMARSPVFHALRLQCVLCMSACANY